MNAYQKAALLVALVALPLMLLFMDGMDYRGTGIAGVVGVALTAGLVYALRHAATDNLPDERRYRKTSTGIFE